MLLDVVEGLLVNHRAHIGGEHQFTAVFVGLHWLRVALATAVHPIRAALFEPLHGKRWACAVAQQALQPRTVDGFDAHTGINREAATVLAGNATLVYVFCVMRFQVAPCHKGAH